MRNFRCEALEKSNPPPPLRIFLNNLPSSIRTDSEIFEAILNIEDFNDAIHRRWLSLLMAYRFQLTSYRELIGLIYELVKESYRDYKCLGGSAVGFSLVDRYLQEWNTEGYWLSSQGQSPQWSGEQISNAWKPATEVVEVIDLSSSPENHREGYPLEQCVWFLAFSSLMKAIVPELLLKSGRSSAALLAFSINSLAQAGAILEITNEFPTTTFRWPYVLCGDYYEPGIKALKRQYRESLLPRLFSLPMVDQK